MEERNDWLRLMQGKVLYLQYLALCKKEQTRPDPHIISLCGRLVPVRMHDRERDSLTSPPPQP